MSKHYPRGPRLNVVVSQSNIDLAVRANSSHCVIAEAVKAAAPWAEFVSVDLQTIRMTSREKQLRYTYLTPRMAQRLIVEFDQGIDPKPFEFKLTGAHVTASGIRPPKADAQTTPKKKRAMPSGPQIIPSSTGPNHGAAVRIGGRPPPLGAHAGIRREFGIRALGGPASRVYGAKDEDPPKA